MTATRLALSKLKYRACARLPPKVYWHLMGRLKPVEAVTSEHHDVESSMDSGAAAAGLLDQLGVVGPESVTLHIGSGLGRIERHLSPHVSRCVGTDVSPSMVKRARVLVRAQNVSFSCSNGRDLSPWPPSSFDLIYSFLVFQHLPREQFSRYLDEARGKLRPGGYLVFQITIDDAGGREEPPTTHPYALRHYTRHEVLERLAQAGFTDISSWQLDGFPDKGLVTDDVVFRAIPGPAPLLTGYPYPFSPRAEVAPFVPRSARSILDVGCGLGGFGATLRAQRPSLKLWGMETDRRAIEEASRHYDHLIAGTFPKDLPNDTPSFDCIVFNDVLEHMVDPWAALSAAVQHLTNDGAVVASIPNVRFGRTVLDLVVRGDWAYTDSGILDRTHLRFFTRRTAHQLLETSGYSVHSVHGINWIGHARSSWSRIIPRLLGDFAYTGFVLVATPT